MEYIAVILAAAAVFGLCFLADKAFTKLFRSQAQHRSGKAVRLNKRYGSIGLILAVFGAAVLFAGLSDSKLLIACGVIMIVVGIGLVVYYMTFGVFYDDNGFVLTTFGKRSTVYAYGDIQGQKLYLSAGNVVLIELYLRDGRTFQLQSVMEGAYSFMDKAFAAWLRQTGRRQEDCPFYDPQNSCWFPPVEA